MGDVAACVGTVGKNGPADVCNDVNMSGTTGVVTREEGLELCDTIGVSWLQAAKEGVVQISGVGRVAVAITNDTTVYTSGVCVLYVSLALFQRNLNEKDIPRDPNTDPRWARKC